jgi:hypothetical protein
LNALQAQRALHAAADTIEPRMTRAFERAMVRARDRVSINDLALTLQAQDARGALALIDRAGLADALSPAGTIVRDTVLRGGRIGAAALEVEP